MASEHRCSDHSDDHGEWCRTCLRAALAEAERRADAVLDLMANPVHGSGPAIAKAIRALDGVVTAAVCDAPEVVPGHFWVFAIGGSESAIRVTIDEHRQAWTSYDLRHEGAEDGE